jgi:type III secretory pathway component EscS
MDQLVLHLTQKTLFIVLLCSAPVVLACAAIGVLMGLIQSLFSLQDAALSSATKIAVAFVVLALVSGWMGSELLSFATTIFDQIPGARR